jgi:hypothetical protein
MTTDRRARKVGLGIEVPRAAFVRFVEDARLELIEERIRVALAVTKGHGGRAGHAHQFKSDRGANE